MSVSNITYSAHIPAASQPSFVDDIVSSSVLKAVCCLPILGNIPSFFALAYSWKKHSETQLKLDVLCGNLKVMQFATDSSESIKHAQICKDYLKMTLIRNALHISLMALGILSSSPLAFAIFIGTSLLTGYYYKKWNDSIQQFEAMNGAQPDLQVPS